MFYQTNSVKSERGGTAMATFPLSSWMMTESATAEVSVFTLCMAAMSECERDDMHALLASSMLKGTKTLNKRHCCIGFILGPIVIQQ